MSDKKSIASDTKDRNRIRGKDAEFITVDEFFHLEPVLLKYAKAKEIIRDLLDCLHSVEYDRVSDLEEAERFLAAEEDNDE